MLRTVALWGILMALTNPTWFVLEEPVQLEVEPGVSVEVREVEVTVVEKAPFEVPDMTVTLQLLENRTYYDGYWCSYPKGETYWFCGPMDGSQFYCQYFPSEGLHKCYDNFLDTNPSTQPW